MTSSLLRPTSLFLIAALLRLILLVYGSLQDARSAIKYTDIDYLVFTDASRYVWQAQSPYARDTYRYTPLLAWLLLPTVSFFSFGKMVFALADLLAGWLILRILRRRGMSPERAGAFAALWLWNPMVATISTRGSSEGLLGVLATALVWAVESRRVDLAAVILGLGVHFKIYPCIWAPAIAWWMDAEHMQGTRTPRKPPPGHRIAGFVSRDRIRLAAVSLATFVGLNVVMYAVYGRPFLVHTFFHHLARIDHRHNFSPYNIVLYLRSSAPHTSFLHAESLAFLPQLSLSCVLIPFVLAKKDLATTMMAQTFAFVTFNKVCTSQYFLWYLVFLPLYLPTSSFLRKPRLGIAALVLWVVSQAAWLQQGYQLEFLGRSTFFPGLWASSTAFFLVNSWILGIIIGDGVNATPMAHSSVSSS
ncbi:Mannosyltransferase, DXD [Metarhizium album ARSEF 1941]|uniref:GPI mannosyltransferase 1 n=1 Tax=Metarhizium album (strain ARSEF 1941) TaxID=1081103 RepID=A0A0B2WNF4_METAS|nr:Mannosyltransferase, DXD [Metarhizium album ARSEF 1941]KHN94535.1 Mannosyltransferase, DXD [Metarhizium album ARSEF 1941]